MKFILNILEFGKNILFRYFSAIKKKYWLRHFKLFLIPVHDGGDQDFQYFVSIYRISSSVKFANIDP